MFGRRGRRAGRKPSAVGDAAIQKASFVKFEYESGEFRSKCSRRLDGFDVLAAAERNLGNRDRQWSGQSVAVSTAAKTSGFGVLRFASSRPEVLVIYGNAV